MRRSDKEVMKRKMSMFKVILDGLQRNKLCVYLIIPTKCRKRYA